MKKFSLFEVILISIVIVFGSLFYREKQVNNLAEKLQRTEVLLRSVSWNIKARTYLLQLGYDIPDPKPVEKEGEK